MKLPELFILLFYILLVFYILKIHEFLGYYTNIRILLILD